MGKKKINYSKQQQDILNYKGEQLLLRGIAGSGKTLLLLDRAKKLAETKPDEQVVVFSYGNPLAESARRQLNADSLENLQVMTFHSWAMKNYFKIFRKKFYLESDISKFLTPAIATVKQKSPKFRFVNNADLKGFVEEEIKWIKGADLCTREAYLLAERHGRGGKIRLSKEDRNVIFDIFESYEKEKEYRMDFEDFGLQISRNLNKIPEASKFDHVFIDEAQDLSKVSMKVLISLAKKTCGVGADKGQKIYATSFSWEEVGLKIRGGRTKVLKDSYRSTKQIIELAYSLQQNDSILQDEEFTRPDLPKAEGSIPTVYKAKSIKSHNDYLALILKTIIKEDPEAVIGILYRDYHIHNNVKNTLKENSIPYLPIRSLGKNEPPSNVGTHHEPGVKVVSLHTSKGLEFDYVLIPEVVDPSIETRLGDDFDWDQERRLLYVGMTRAREHLHLLTHGDSHKLIDELNEELYTFKLE